MHQVLCEFWDFQLGTEGARFLHLLWGSGRHCLYPSSQVMSSKISTTGEEIKGGDTPLLIVLAGEWLYHLCSQHIAPNQMERRLGNTAHIDTVLVSTKCLCHHHGSLLRITQREGRENKKDFLPFWELTLHSSHFPYYAGVFLICQFLLLFPVLLESQLLHVHMC